MRDDAGGEYPFELELIDVGLPGSGKDTVVLTVGNGARTSENATPAQRIGIQLHGQRNARPRRSPADRHRSRPRSGGRPAGAKLTEARPKTKGVRPEREPADAHSVRSDCEEPIHVAAARS